MVVSAHHGASYEFFAKIVLFDLTVAGVILEIVLLWMVIFLAMSIWRANKRPKLTPEHRSLLWLALIVEVGWLIYKSRRLSHSHNGMLLHAVASLTMQSGNIFCEISPVIFAMFGVTTPLSRRLGDRPRIIISLGITLIITAGFALTFLLYLLLCCDTVAGAMDITCRCYAPLPAVLPTVYLQQDMDLLFAGLLGSIHALFAFIFLVVGTFIYIYSPKRRCLIFYCGAMGITSIIDCFALLFLHTSPGICLWLHFFSTLAYYMVYPFLLNRSLREDHFEVASWASAFQYRSDDGEVYAVPFSELKIDSENLYKQRVLGSGSFSVVELHLWKRAGEPDREVAVKRLHNRGPAHTVPQLLMEFGSEVSCMKHVSCHPNIIDLLGVAVFPSHPNLAIVMEYAERGSMMDLLKFGQLDEARAGSLTLELARDIAASMAHLHSLSRVHLDLKLNNVLVSNEWRAKLCDFGISREIRVYGALAHQAPERLRANDPRSAAKADVYSFGIILWACCARKCPFLRLSREMAFSTRVPTASTTGSGMGGVGAAAVSRGPLLPHSSTLPHFDLPLYPKHLGRSWLVDLARELVCDRELRPPMPDWPPSLAGLISACTAPLPHDRPSFAEILRNHMPRVLEECDRSMVTFPLEVPGCQVGPCQVMGSLQSLQMDSTMDHDMDDTLEIAFTTEGDGGSDYHRLED